MNYKLNYYICKKLNTMNITNFKIRASYPNFFMLNLYMEQNRFIFEKENEREGNKPGTVIYQLENDDNL